MGRYFGGVFGNTLASDVGLDVAKGVFTLSDHYYSKAEGGWSVPLGASGNPYTSWTSLNAQGFTNTTKYLQLAGNTYNIQIDDSGYAKFSIPSSNYTRFYYGNGRNTCCGSASGSCDNSSVTSYTVGNRLEWATEQHTGWDDWGWTDANGDAVSNSFFQTMESQLSTGYRGNQWWLGHNDVETNSCLEWKFADGTTSGAHNMSNNSGGQNVFDHDYTSQLNSWIGSKIFTSMKTNANTDPAAMIITWRHSGMCIK